MESGLKELCFERLNKAYKSLDDAEYNLRDKRLHSASNRIYYAVFHAMRAVNATEGFDSSKHSGVIAYFNKNFIKNNRLPEILYKNIRDFVQLREKSDYEDFFTPDEEDVSDQLNSAKEFLSAVDVFLKDYFSSDG